MGFVNKFWRFFRLGMLVIAFIGVTFYLLISTNWSRIFYGLPTYSQVIKEGQPLVGAIYRFKAERGLWPEYLDDLVPGYLSREQVNSAERSGWFYEVRTDGPGLSQPTDLRRTHVGFDFDRAKPSWLVFGEADNRVLKVETLAEAGGAATTLPAEKVVENELAELDKRIKRTHVMVSYDRDGSAMRPSAAMMEYRRQKASLLLSLGREAEAREEINAALAADGDHFWPRLAMVAIELKKPVASSQKPEVATTEAATRPAALGELDAWVRGHASFTRWYYLSVAYRLANRDADAVAAVEEAAKLNPELAPEDGEVMAFYFWDMARFALRQEKWDLVVQLTAAWEKTEAERRRFKQDSYLALRAAAKLAKADVAGAQADMEMLNKRGTTTWAQHRDLLEAAVKKGDKGFRYDPGDRPPMYEVFKVPQ